METSHKIQIGISSCLLGEEVRYDGGHKRNVYITGTLSSYFDFKAICPEMAIGLGVPRPTIRLIDKGAGIRVVGVKDADLDVTDELQNFSLDATSQLQSISGYILKKDSPSCGMERVRVYNSNDMPEKRGRGIFADTLIKALPNLPAKIDKHPFDKVFP